MLPFPVLDIEASVSAAVSFSTLPTKLSKSPKVHQPTRKLTVAPKLPRPMAPAMLRRRITRVVTRSQSKPKSGMKPKTR